MQRRDEGYLLDVLEAAGLIADFIAEVDRGTFDASRMIQSAVCYQLAIIGEACNKLSSTLQASYPDIPWRQIIGMRNMLIHQYGSIDLDIAWNAAHFSAPSLAAQVARILDEGASQS